MHQFGASFELNQMSWWQILSFILTQENKIFCDLAISMIYKFQLHIGKHAPNLNIYLSIFTLHIHALPTSVTPSAQTEAPLTPYSKYHLPSIAPGAP